MYNETLAKSTAETACVLMDLWVPMSLWLEALVLALLEALILKFIPQ